MIQKQSFNVIKGMRQDISPSKANPEYIFDARNIRLTARGNDTLLSISNEQGSKKIYAPTSTIAQPIDLIKGKVLGYCVLNNYLVTFSTDTMYSGDIVDYITRVYMANNVWFSDILYSSHSFVQNKNGEKEFKEVSGRLNFGDNIQTLGVYENENIQKVYWVDEINQPRVINIVKEQLENKSVEDIATSYINTSFDFVPTLNLQEKVTITANSNSNGNFQAGVIQYAFTYYNKYGQESNIFYTTDLLNIAYPDRGGSPEDKLPYAFNININNLDPNFSKIRIYSIHRTSINATPSVKRVTDISYVYQESGVKSKDSYYYTRFNNTPIIYEDYINYPNDYKIIDNCFNTVYLTGGIRNGKGDYYVFRRGDYKNSNGTYKSVIFLIDYQEITFSSSATDDTKIIISKDANVSGPGGGGRLITTNDTTSLAIVSQKIFATSVNFIDTNTTGESVDPTELLYIGGEEIIARTLNQKDNTLFLGNISIKRPSVLNSIKTQIKNSIVGDLSDNLSITTRDIISNTNISDYYTYSNQLSVTNPTTFKNGEHYRLGLQFQYKNGKWSEPIVLTDEYIVNQAPSIEINSTANTIYKVPVIKYTLPATIAQQAIEQGFIRVRPLIVNPSFSDRLILAQGMLCPTIRTNQTRVGETENSETQYYSSWFLRTIAHTDKYISNFSCGDIPSFIHGDSVSPQDNQRRVEIEGLPVPKSITVDQNIVTFHSPDIEFDESLQLLDLQKINLSIIGTINFNSSYGDISIQTSSPAIGGAGFMHKSLNVPMDTVGFGYASYSLVSGLFYKDYLVNDYNPYKPNGDRSFQYNFMIYPWQSSGSLNNDIVRPSDKGARSAVLKRKVISNIKYAERNTLFTPITYNNLQIHIFNSNEVSLTKIDNNQYFGNVDTLIVGNESSKYIGKSFEVESTSITQVSTVNAIGEDFKYYNPSIRIKYKSSPHIVVNLGTSDSDSNKKIILPSINNQFNKCTLETIQQPDIEIAGISALPNLFLGELRRTKVDNAFGGNNEIAYKNNLWIPSGESTLLDAEKNVTLQFLHGDCYYQRYDCLKTYPFTQEDENSIVEIGSFMVETRVNIDGRYDRNRGLLSNLNITPQNFNLLNTIYSQKDNFFNYRMLDDDFYKLNNFPNTITWSKEKMTSEEVDTWTNITMANTFDMDGNLGQIQSIENYNNELYCFQDKGISRILFNNRVQIPTGDNIPIEISNGYKVQGKVYLSNTVGCQNQKAIKVTPNGIYFSDLYNSGIYLLNQQGMQDISTPRGFTNWVKECQPDRLHYDANNGDLYLMGNGYSNNFYKNCLCFSEKINEFTSFMDYYSNKYMFNIQNNFYAIKDYDVYHDSGTHFMQMFSGDYMKDYHITYIANQSPTNDKIFNTIEFRADTLKPDDKLVISDINSKSPNICPFNKVTVWNEYQEGEASLSKILGKPSNLKEKFRTWRVNIPRDKSNNRDRIRNPWAYIKLEGSNNTNRMQLHDLQVWYYDNSVYGYNQRHQ